MQEEVRSYLPQFGNQGLQSEREQKRTQRITLLDPGGARETEGAMKKMGRLAVTEPYPGVERGEVEADLIQKNRPTDTIEGIREVHLEHNQIWIVTMFIHHSPHRMNNGFRPGPHRHPNLERREIITNIRLYLGAAALGSQPPKRFANSNRPYTSGVLYKKSF